jgi:type 1 glutamine amidotransferase
MNCPRALLFHGGWDGHKPQEVAQRLQADLTSRGLDVDLSATLDCLDDAGAIERFQLFIPCWTMGTLSDAQAKNLEAAVRAGAGCAGLHGGAGDAFRGNLNYEWMIGGHFVGHPHVGDYTVRVTSLSSPITDGLPLEMPYRSEQYYMMIDPVIDVLAESIYTHEGRRCVMPVAWTKMWGKGRVFYSALGHQPSEFDAFPQTYEMALRGITWAAGLL